MRIINFSGGSTTPAFKINDNRKYVRTRRRARGLGPAGAERLPVQAAMELELLQQLGEAAVPVEEHRSLVVNQEKP